MPVSTQRTLALALTRHLTALGLLLCAAAASAQTVLPPSAPRLIAGPGGEADVVFNNDCIVSFDKKGRETRRLPACNPQQVQQAQQLDTQRRLPPVTLLGGGYARVAASRSCTVGYNPSGQREGTPRECSNSELAAADAAINEYRRSQGAGRPGATVLNPQPLPPGGVVVPGAATPPAAKPILGTRDGRLMEMGATAAEVHFDNGCIARIEAFGQRAKPNARCTAAQVARAEELVAIRAIERNSAAQQGSGS